MSLIDDALKRAQAADEAASGRPAERPWIPTPMPDASLARRRKIFRWLSIALAAAAALAGGAIVLVRAAAPPPEPQREAPPATTATPLQVVVLVSTPTTPAASIAGPVRARPTRAPAAPPPPSEVDAVSAAPAEDPPTPVPRAAGSIVAGRTYPGSVTLPGGGRIELGGIVWSETEPRALLNDRILAIGSYVEGFTVAGIEENRVALEKDGVTIYLSVK